MRSLLLAAVLFAGCDKLSDTRATPLAAQKLDGPFESIAAWCSGEEDCGARWPDGPAVTTSAGAVTWVMRRTELDYDGTVGQEIFLALTTPRGTYVRRIGSVGGDGNRSGVGIRSVSADPREGIALEFRAMSSHSSVYGGSSSESVIFVRGGDTPAAASLVLATFSGQDVGSSKSTAREYLWSGPTLVVGDGSGSSERMKILWP